MKNKVEFDFGYFHIENNVVIGTMKEGSHIDLITNRLILSYCNEYFKERPFGYISHRLYSYSIDPLVYSDSAMQIGLQAIAVVSNNSIYNSNILIEKQFFSQPFEAFTKLEDAKNWLSQIVIY